MDFNTLQYFGLGDDPFRSVLGGEVFQSKELKQGRKLMDAVRKSGGLAAIIGDWGSGKSMIVQSAEEAWSEDDRVVLVRPVNLDLDRVTGRAIAIEIIREIGDEREAVPMGSTAVGRLLRERLGAFRLSGRRLVLVLEEAHDLRYQVLRGLKTMTELSWAGICPLFGVVLVGHRKLQTHFERWPEVGERVLTLTMRGMSQREIGDYINLKVKSVGGPAGLFEAHAVAQLHKLTGQPLFVNTLAAQAMVRAHREGHLKVTAGDILGTNGESRLLNLQVLAAEAKRHGIDQGTVGASIGLSKTETSQLVHGKSPSLRADERTMQLTEAFCKAIAEKREGATGATRPGNLAESGRADSAKDKAA